MYFIYCVRKKQISNFKVDEISTPSDKCSVSTSIVCDSDTIIYTTLRSPQKIVLNDLGPQTNNMHVVYNIFNHWNLAQYDALLGASNLAIPHFFHVYMHVHFCKDGEPD